jgi:hypothetical protein
VKTNRSCSGRRRIAFVNHSRSSAWCKRRSVSSSSSSDGSGKQTGVIFVYSSIDRRCTGLKRGYLYQCCLSETRHNGWLSRLPGSASGHRSIVQEVCGWPEPEDGDRPSWHQRLLPTEPSVADWPIAWGHTRPPFRVPTWSPLTAVAGRPRSTEYSITGYLLPPVEPLFNMFFFDVSPGRYRRLMKYSHVQK